MPRMIPEFTDDGYLPVGVHSATLQEVEERFGYGNRRKDLLICLKRALTHMENCGVVNVYLGGGFVTDKPRPRDIDGCYDLSDTVDQTKMVPFLPMTSNNRAMQKMAYKSEFFPSDMIETDSGIPFIDFFQSDESGNPKGIVALSL